MKKYYLKLKKGFKQKDYQNTNKYTLKKKNLSNQNFLCKNVEEKKVQN